MLVSRILINTIDNKIHIYIYIYINWTSNLSPNLAYVSFFFFLKIKINTTKYSRSLVVSCWMSTYLISHEWWKLFIQKKKNEWLKFIPNWSLFFFFFIRLVDSGHKNRLSLFNFNGSIVKFIIGSHFFLNFNGSNWWAK